MSPLTCRIVAAGSMWGTSGGSGFGLKVVATSNRSLAGSGAWRRLRPNLAADRPTLKVDAGQAKFGKAATLSAGAVVDQGEVATELAGRRGGTYDTT
jgi:hypothetical protein